MSKVYVLWEQDYSQFDSTETKIVGVITNKDAAKQFDESSPKFLSISRYMNEIELDDPELLNRIAKENSK